MKLHSTHLQGVTKIATCAVLVALCACHNKDKLSHVDAVDDRSQQALLSTYDVQCLVSDSGVTRYRMNTKEYLIYDQAHPPYWEFPQGVYLEKFDQDLNVNASLEADYAHYNDSAHIWTLRGNVKALNLQGETFETPLLIWEEKGERIHSDSAITITKKKSIIHGIGFESNQEMTKYKILNPTGIIPIEEEEGKEEKKEDK